jgi:hypothetical protein
VRQFIYDDMRTVERNQAADLNDHSAMANALQPALNCTVVAMISVSVIQTSLESTLSHAMNAAMDGT